MNAHVGIWPGGLFVETTRLGWFTCILSGRFWSGFGDLGRFLGNKTILGGDESFIWSGWFWA